MKTINEQVEYLLQKFNPHIDSNTYLSLMLSIESAIVCVELIIESQPTLPVLGDDWLEDIELSTEYWNNVLTELKSRL